MSVYLLEIGFRRTPDDLEELLFGWNFVRNTNWELNDPVVVEAERRMAREIGVDYQPTRVYQLGGNIEARQIFAIDPESALLRRDPEISSELALEIWNMRYKDGIFLMGRALRDKYEAMLYDAQYGRVILD